MSNNILHIVVGSRSIHKITAVEIACRKLDLTAVVTGIKTFSGQNEQPIDFAETFLGATTRALAVHKEHPHSIAIGIESGVFSSMNIHLDVAVIVVIKPDSKKIITTSSGFLIPEEFVKINEEKGFEKNTIGSVVAEKLGGDPQDPHFAISKGKVSRKELLASAIKIALEQI